MPYVPRANAEDEPHPNLTADEILELDDEIEDEVEGAAEIPEVEILLLETKPVTKPSQSTKVTFKGS